MISDAYIVADIAVRYLISGQVRQLHYIQKHNGYLGDNYYVVIYFLYIREN